MDEELLKIDAIIKSELGVSFVKQEEADDESNCETENIGWTDDPLEFVEKIECPDPLEFVENLKAESFKDNNDDSNIISQQNDCINELVSTVMNRLRNPFQLYGPEASLTSTTETENPNRRRRKTTTTTYEQEARLLKQRMIQMKNRLLLQLELPEKAKAVKERTKLAVRLKRQLVRESETPEEAAERKKRHAAQVRLSRKRLMELETPEQRVARISRRNEKKKLRLQAKQAKETPEERAARRERERMYREKRRQLPGKLAMHTGKIRTRRNRKIDHESLETEKVTDK